MHCTCVEASALYMCLHSFLLFDVRLCVSILFLLLRVQVALIIEVTEEDDEGDAVTKHQHVHAVGEVALCKQVVACVQEKQQKLHLEKQQTKFRPLQVTSQTYCEQM